MPHGSRSIALVLVVVGMAVASRAARAEPLIELTDEGRTFVYTARPGDSPGAVASSFGLPEWPIFVILGIDELMDMARTSVNVVGNCLATVVIAKWENAFRNDEWRKEEAELEEVTGLEPIVST